MRHHWLILIPKNTMKVENLKAIVNNQVLPSLIWKPENLLLHQLPHGTLVLSASSNAKLFGYEAPYALDNEDVCLVSGLPTLEAYNIASNADVPKSIFNLLNQYTPSHLYNHLGGTWSLAKLGQQTLQVFADFCGYNTCYYADTDSYFAVSNKAKLVAALQTQTTPKRWSIFKKPSVPRYNYQALSWMFSTTMIQGHETAFTGVNKLRSGYGLTYDFKTGLKLSRLSPNYDDPLGFETEKDYDRHVQDRIAALERRTSWYVDRGIPLDSHITGGKDSRTIIALLAGSGRLKDIQKISTTGTDDNGDVIVARKIAKCLGITQQHKVNPGNKTKITPKIDDVLHGFFHSAFKYDGQLTPFDGRAKPFPKFPHKAAFMGGGGEIYRQKYLKNHISLEGFVEQFTKWSYRYDALGILTPTAKSFQKQQIEARAEEFFELGIKNQQAKYYIDHRLSNWGAGHFQASSGNTIPLLLDIGLARAMFCDQDMGEHIHFDIIRHSCPELLKVPFHNQRWAGPTRERAASLDLDINPIEIPIAKSFPWQFDIYEKYRDTFIDIALEYFDPHYDDFIIKNALRQLKNTETSFGSAHIKMLFGLVMCQLCFSHKSDLLTDPDGIEGTSTQYEGNQSNALTISAIDVQRSSIRSSDIYQAVIKKFK